MTKRSYRYTSGLTLIIALSMNVAQTGTESVEANDMKSNIAVGPMRRLRK